MKTPYQTVPFYGRFTRNEWQTIASIRKFCGDAMAEQVKQTFLAAGAWKIQHIK